MTKKLNGINTLENVNLSNSTIEEGNLYKIAKCSLYGISSSISSGNLFPYNLGISYTGSDLQPTSGSKVINVSDRNIEVQCFGKCLANSISSGGNNIIHWEILQDGASFLYPAEFIQRTTGVQTNGSSIFLYTSMPPQSTISMKLHHGFLTTAASNCQLIVVEDPYVNFNSNIILTPL